VNANDGTGNHTWNYSWSPPTTVTDPLGNNTVYTYATNTGQCQTYVGSVNYYQGAVQPANLLKTVTTTYSATASPFSQYLGTNFMNIVPNQITTTWANGKTSQVTKTYDSGFTFPSPRPNDNTRYTGLYGKVIVQKDYDYGTTSGQPGPLLRQTNTSYVWQSPNPNYATYQLNINGIVNGAFTGAVAAVVQTAVGPQAPADISCANAAPTQILCSQDSGGQIIVPKPEDHGQH